MKKNTVKTILLWMAIIFVIVFSLAPALWQLLTSFKVNEDISKLPTIYFPSRITFNHYVELFTRTPPFWRYILNSAFVSILSTAFALGIGAPAAYALARLRPEGSKYYSCEYFNCYFIPRNFVIFWIIRKLYSSCIWGNNYLALIIPYTAINLPLTILVLRSFFEQLPKDLEDSARVGRLQYLANANANYFTNDSSSFSDNRDSYFYICMERIYIRTHIYYPRKYENNSRCSGSIKWCIKL